jgi:hypothetical protein
MQRPCDELIACPRSPADCSRSSNRNETESFMEVAKARNWAVEPQEKKKLLEDMTKNVKSKDIKLRTLTVSW